MNDNKIKAVCCFLIACMLCLLAVIASSCKTLKPTPSVTTEVKYDSILIEKLVPIYLSPDSARIRALLECDKNGKVFLKWFDAEHSKRMSLQFKLDSLGNLLADIKTNPDTIYIPTKTQKVSKSSTSTKIIPYEVEKKLSWFQVFLLWSGGIAWLIITGIFIGWLWKKGYISKVLSILKKAV